MEFYIKQGISILTALLAVVMMQFKSMKMILLGQITVNLLAASTFFLFGGLSGAGICFVAIIQTIVMFFYNRKNKLPHISVTILFILLYIGCSVYYYKSFVDIFSALAAIRHQMSRQEHNIKDESNQARAYRAGIDPENSTIRDNNPYLYSDPDNPLALPETVLPKGGIYNLTEYSLTSYDFRGTVSYNADLGENGDHIISLFGGICSVNINGPLG